MIFKQEKKGSNIVYHGLLFSQLNRLLPKQVADTAGFFIVDMPYLWHIYNLKLCKKQTFHNIGLFFPRRFNNSFNVTLHKVKVPLHLCKIK